MSRAKRLFCQCVDRLGGRDQLFGLPEVQKLRHLPVDHQDAFAGIDRVFERRDYRLCLGNRFGLWRKNPVGCLDLGGVDQGLAVKAQPVRFLDALFNTIDGPYFTTQADFPGKSNFTWDCHIL